LKRFTTSNRMFARSSRASTLDKRYLATVSILACLFAFGIVLVIGAGPRAAGAWGVAAGTIVFGFDSRRFLGISVIFLLLPALFSLLGLAAAAESLAETAFYFLALGVALEFRSGFSRPSGQQTSPIRMAGDDAIEGFGDKH